MSQCLLRKLRQPSTGEDAPELTPSTVFAIEQVAHHASSFLVRFGLCSSFVGIHRTLGCRVGILRVAAVGTTVGEAGLVGFEFELFRADGADFDWVSHFNSAIWKVGTLAHLATNNYKRSLSCAGVSADSDVVPCKQRRLAWATCREPLFCCGYRIYPTFACHVGAWLQDVDRRIFENGL